MARSPQELLEAIMVLPRQHFSSWSREEVFGMTKRGQITERDLETRMYYTKPDEERAKRHVAVQDAAYEFGLALIQNCPNPSRELALAITKLEEARMWGNAAIAHAQADEAVLATQDAPTRSDRPSEAPGEPQE